MRIYFLAIPIVIGILFGILVSYEQDDSLNSSVLSKKNLLDGASILGDPNALITVVEFGDYQCTFCYKFHQNTFNNIQIEYVDTGKVNYVYRDFPLNGHDSVLAAEASYCAGDQGEYWIYNNFLLINL